MKANELMIGDWVKLDFYDNAYADKEDAVWKNGKVTAIHHGNWVDVNFGDPLDECDILVCDIQPIPLTAEILEKNGWRQYSPYFSNDNADFELEPYRDGGFGIRVSADEYGSGTFACIKYVHQLQHALRLCGIEKEIVL